MLAVKCVRTKASPDGPFDIHAYQCENKVIHSQSLHDVVITDSYLAGNGTGGLQPL